MKDQIIQINLVPNMSTPAVVRVSQYDVGRPLVFKVYDGTSPADLTGVTAVIEGTKRSGLGFSESGTVTDNTVTLNTTLAMTQEDGSIPAEIRFSKTGEDVGTANFILAVEPSPHLEGTTDGTTETMADLQSQLDALDERVEALEGGGGGLTQTEKSLILELFSKAAYAEDDAGDAYDTLEALWTTTTRTITYNLSHVSSSNTTASVENGQSYTTTLTAATDYTLNTVTVTMGGVDITSTSYSSGTVSIPSVTGNIVITATAILAALYPLVNGTKTFLKASDNTATNRVVTVSYGNTVRGELTQGYSKDIHANVSDVTLNTDACNDGANYRTSTAKLFTIPSGASVSYSVTPLAVSYADSTIGAKKMNITVRNKVDNTAPELFKLLTDTSYDALVVGTPITGSFTAESDMDVWSLGMWMASSGSKSAIVELELELTVNGTRYI